MKKFFSVMFCFVLLVTSSVSAFANAAYPTVRRNFSLPYGASSSTDVISINNQTAIALDDLLWYLGVDTFGHTGSAHRYFRSKDKSVEMYIVHNTDQAYINDVATTMPFKSFTYNNKLYVPLSFVCEALGYVTYWRAENQTIYIQDEEHYDQALMILYFTVDAVSSEKTFKTKIDNKVSMRYYGDTAEITTVGEMQTDMEKEQAYLYQKSQYSQPVSRMSDRMEVIDETEAVEYVTPKGIYAKNAKGQFEKGPATPDYISVMDMATKSAFTDLDLFLYSAYVKTDENGNYTIQSQTDLGLLLGVGFSFYMPDSVNTLDWSNTYQTITYDKETFLPLDLSYRFYASYVPDALSGEKLSLTYEYDYSFDWGVPVSIVLPAGVE